MKKNKWRITIKAVAIFIILWSVLTIYYMPSHSDYAVESFYKKFYHSEVQYGLCILLVGIALLRFYGWARALTIIFSIFNLYNASLGYMKWVSLISTYPEIFMVDSTYRLIRMLCDLLIIYFFTRPKVKEQFK